MYKLQNIGTGIKETSQYGSKDSLDASQDLRSTIPIELYALDQMSGLLNRPSTANVEEK